MKTLKIIFVSLLTFSFLISCKKEYSYEGGNVFLASGTWEFQHNTVQYDGTIDSAVIQNVSGTKVLTLAGRSLNGQENFRIRLYTTDSFIVAGYPASLSASDLDYFTSSKTIYKGDFLAGEFTVNIISLSDNIITGTFSGQVEDSTGAKTQLTLGSFTSKIDLSRNNGTTLPETQSTGTLGANPDTCTPVTIAGTYKKGLLFSAANTVEVQVNVSTPGTFIIATNSVNGVSFFKSGNFTTRGIQNIILDGSGTPENQGVQYFTVTYGNSNCIFPITFLPAVIVTGDYFPNTINSNWAYGIEGATGDSVFVGVDSYAPTIGGNVYSAFIRDNVPPSGDTDTIYFRKSANDYIVYQDVSDFFQFDDPVFEEYKFLNDQVPVGTSLKSPDFTGKVAGLPVSGFVQATIDEKGVPASIGTMAFDDVIKVTYRYYFTFEPNTPQVIEEKWFARGVGLIYDNLDNFVIYSIGRYAVL